MNKWKTILISAYLFLPSLVFAQWDTFDIEGFFLPDATVTDIIENLVTWLFIIIGTIAVISFVIAGILYLTSAGDEDQLKRAKRAMTYSIIGIIVALAGGVAVNVAINLWEANTI